MRKGVIWPHKRENNTVRWSNVPLNSASKSVKSLTHQ